MRLPEGYRVDKDPDVWTLYYGPEGEHSVIVARFAAGAPDEEIEAAAEEHRAGE